MEQKKKTQKKRLRWTYLISTGITGLWMAGGAIGAWLGLEEMSSTLSALGYPDYFHFILAIGKTIGITLLIVKVPDWLKSMAYGGILIELVSAVFSYNASGQGFISSLPPLLFLGIVLVSFFAYRKMSPKQVAV